MQPIQQLTQQIKKVFSQHSAQDRPFLLLNPNDLHSLLSEHSNQALKALITRAEKLGVLKRVCRGLYLYPADSPTNGLLLYHAAAKLRAHEFNYISLESALSDAGVISQIPIHWITILSSGRSYTQDCGDWGRIEFIHTKKKPEALKKQLSYDKQCGLWRASVPLAMQDMKNTQRDLSLIDWEVANEFIR